MPRKISKVQKLMNDKLRKIIKHRSPMQTKKSQPSGQRIMPETRLTLLPAFSVYPPGWEFSSAPETNDKFYLSELTL